MTTSTTTDARATGRRVLRMEAEALAEVERRDSEVLARLVAAHLADLRVEEAVQLAPSLCVRAGREHVLLARQCALAPQHDELWLCGLDDPTRGTAHAECALDGVPGARVVAENVAVASSLNAAVEALVESPSHYQNMTDPRFTKAGMAAVTGRDGRTYVVQVFAG